MGDVVNLRRARKAVRRAAENRQAADNRARFGRSKAERQSAAEELRRRDAMLDGLRLDRPDPAGDA